MKNCGSKFHYVAADERLFKVMQRLAKGVDKAQHNGYKHRLAGKDANKHQTSIDYNWKAFVGCFELFGQLHEGSDGREGLAFNTGMF